MSVPHTVVWRCAANVQVMNNAVKSWSMECQTEVCVQLAHIKYFCSKYSKVFMILSGNEYLQPGDVRVDIIIIETMTIVFIRMFFRGT